MPRKTVMRTQNNFVQKFDLYLINSNINVQSEILFNLNFNLTQQKTTDKRILLLLYSIILASKYEVIKVV